MAKQKTKVSLIHPTPFVRSPDDIVPSSLPPRPASAPSRKSKRKAKRSAAAVGETSMRATQPRPDSSISAVWHGLDGSQRRLQLPPDVAGEDQADLIAALQAVSQDLGPKPDHLTLALTLTSSARP